MKQRIAAALAVVLLGATLAGCQRPTATPAARYHLGQPYETSGVWHYPAENYALDETGLASVNDANHPALTTNGEVFDHTALAASHPTLQLPAIARLTNLETGLSVLVRINDRGAGNPKRLVETTQRAAQLIGLSGVARVRLEVQAVESREAVESMPGAPRLSIAAAPRAAVQSAELSPLGAARPTTVSAAPSAPPDAAEPRRSASPIARLPETVAQFPPRPGKLWVRLDTFENYRYAAMQRARMSGFQPRIVSLRQGRQSRFRTDIGPLDRIEQAESALDAAFAAGIPDARIVVD